MAGASRFMTLLAAPIPLLLHRHPRPFLLRLSLLRSSAASLPPLSSSSLSSICRPKLCSPANSSQKFHSQSNSNTVQDDHFGVSLNHPSSHPWPEWSKFVDSLSSCGNFFQERGAVRVEDEFVAYEELSEEFVRASHACLAFSRERSDLLRLLSRRHIKVVVENGTPFLFKSALDTSRRMRSFLGIGGENVLESDKAQTADLMKYLLSYASDPAVSSGRGGLCRGELLEPSVRNLFTELSRLCSGAQEPDPSMTYNLAEGYGQTQRPIGQKIEMKRGDWICSKCNFMNFARNMKCLECKETRPKRQLTGGEWECPQCDFYNYGRNQVCLRCDCKRPGEASYGANSSSGLGHENLAYANKPDIDSRLAGNEEKAQRWFGKISQMDGASDLSSAAADEDFPEIMPLRKGENRFVGSARKTPLQRRLANSQYQQNLSNEGLSQGNDFQRKGLNPKGRDSSYADYVPLPSDMYAKKPQVSKVEDGGTAGAESSDSLSSSMPMKQVESSDKVNEQDGKSETWFKKLAELHDDKGVSTISNGDFPETMPTQTGQNRFVVSRTKDRSLTSPMYKRKMAVEKAGNTNFVPFVPFPPDYFAKKDKEPNMGDPVPTAKTETPSSVGPDRAGDWSDRTSSTNPSPITENQQMESTKRPSLITENQKTGSTRQLGNGNSYAEWKGKSLEGSAVQELDPLDMSEEAKAQRWFRRVAQIKDISELSQIPDEDFPSIMPMRKGVNRFVVSKRKTPLERRLTSPQYKRNLPIVSSDPPKKENESS